MKSPKNFDMRDLSHGRLIDALKKVDTFVPLSSNEKNWHLILRLLPMGLRQALLNELTLGNRIISIQYGDWPQKGSVVISLAADFKGTYSEGNPYGVTYRRLNDPHYWIADIHENVQGVEYLIIH